jgi:single-strand DNA-binding protein
MNETTVTITGNVITDVKSRLAGEGVRVASFRMASNERRFDKSTGQWVDGDRLYVTVTCWRRLAHNVSNSLFKGDPIVVTGRLYTRGYEVEGQKRSVTELEASAVGPDLSRCEAQLIRVQRPAVERPQPDQVQVVTEPPAEGGSMPAVPAQAAATEPGAERPVLAAVGGV